MNNPEKLAIYGTQYEDKQKQKNITRTPPKTGLKSGSQVLANDQQLMFLCMTSAVLLVHTVKSGKSLSSDRGKKTST